MGGDDAGDAILNECVVVEEEEVDACETDNGVDVEEEYSVEEGDACHFEIVECGCLSYFWLPIKDRDSSVTE